MRSAIYEGQLAHHRVQPDHGFQFRLAMPLLDLDEIDEVVAAHPLWSNERANAVSFRRADHLGDPATPLATVVRDLVEERTGARPAGPIAALAHVRTWGWLFNPIAVYYCFDATGRSVEHTVLSVTNTPWKERHAYVLGAPGEHDVAKALHVSPFFGMDQRYRINLSAPADDLDLTIAVSEHGERVFASELHLHRREISRAALGRVLWRHPMLTARVSAGIHANALRLWRKGAPLHRHPPKGGGDHARSHDRECSAETAA